MGQTISATQFFVYGKRHFTKTGYLKHVSAYYKTPPPSSPSAAAAADDAIDLTNKVVVVTGANSGLGKQVATYVASKGATLYMLCRSKDRAETARTEILKDTQCNADKVKVVLADVSELEQVRTVVSQITEAEVHCLVCNAGVLLNEQSNSSEGLEATFASHLLGGTYLLTTLLMPKLSAAQNGRVVVVTSGGMYTTALPSWDVMTSYTSNLGEAPSTSPPEQFKYDGTMAYAYAKRGQVVLVEEWSKVYPKMNFCTVHPGWTDTPAVDDAFGDKKKYLEPLREPWQGAEGVAWLTGCSNVESGELYLDRKVQKKHIAGPFMSEGSFTKNTAEEIEEFMANLKRTAGV